jgi:putative colanic acid biosynthesis glycosyltransferase
MIDISIISVAKNNQAGLKKTYQSIIRQDIDFNKIEWVVKDAASTDQTAEWLRETEKEKKLPNFTWDSSMDKGLYDGMNIALSLAKGQYVLFLNSGDYLYTNDVLSKTVAVIRENHDNLPTFLLGDDIVDNIDKRFIFRKARDIQYLWHSLPCSHQAIFYNKSHIGNIRYNLNYPICGDYQFTLEIYRNNYHGHKHLGFIVPVFEAGGHAIRKRLQLCEEAYLIKKEIAGTPFLIRSFSFAAGYINNILMHYFPRGYHIHRRFLDKIIANPNKTL